MNVEKGSRGFVFDGKTVNGEGNYSCSVNLRWEFSGCAKLRSVSSVDNCSAKSKVG